MAVPPGARHADEGDARLDQPARDQCLLAKGAWSVGVADRLRLARHVEERLAGHQAADALVGLVVRAQGAGGGRAAAREALTHELAELAALAVVEVVDRFGAADVLGGQARCELDRGIARAEEAGRSGREVAPLGLRVERDVVGDCALEPPQLASDHGAHVGVMQAGVVGPPPHHQASAAAVVAVLGVQRADDAGVLHPLGHLRHQLRDRDAGDRRRDRPERSTGRRPGLRVPRLELARPARQPEQDHVLLLLLELAGQGRLRQDVEPPSCRPPAAAAAEAAIVPRNRRRSKACSGEPQKPSRRLSAIGASLNN